MTTAELYALAEKYDAEAEKAEEAEDDALS